MESNEKRLRGGNETGLPRGRLIALALGRRGRLGDKKEAPWSQAFSRAETKVKKTFG